MSRIIIVTPMFDTKRSGIRTAIACALAKHHDVTVISGREGLPPGHDDTRMGEEFGIKVIRCKDLKYERNKSINRLVGHLRFTNILCKRAVQEMHPGDTVLVLTDPITLVPAMARLKKKHDFRLAVLVHDVFPENSVAAGMISKRNPLYQLVLKLFNKAYAQADLIITIGSDMKELLEQKTRGLSRAPRIEVASNWAFHSVEAPLEYPESDRVTIKFAGTIGRLQGLPEFVELLESVHNPSVQFDIHGGGAKRATLETMIADFKDSTINLRPPYEGDDEMGILGSGDISLVSLVDGMYGLGVPSKTYTIMMAGRPILYIGERHTEIWNLIENEGIGFCFTPSDHEGIRHFLSTLTPDKKPMLRAMGEKAYNVCCERYTKEKVLQKYCELF